MKNFKELSKESYYDNEQKKVFSNPFLNEWGNLLIGENQKKSIKDILEYNTILFKKDRSYSKEMKLKDKIISIIKIILPRILFLN